MTMKDYMEWMKQATNTSELPSNLTSLVDETLEYAFF